MIISEKIDKLALEAAEIFDVALEKNLTLLTIRHFDDATINSFTNGKEIVLEQKTEETIQVLMR